MANLVLQNNTKAKSTDITLKVNGSSDWKISNNNGTFIINSTNNLLSIDTDGNVKIHEGHLFLDGATTNSANNTTQVVFRQKQSDGSMLEHIALSSNDDAFVINPASNSTTSQVVLYLGADRTSLLPSSLKIDKNLTVTGTSTLTGTVYIKSGASATATLAGPTTAGTFTFPNTGGTFVTHETRGTAVGGSTRPVYIASSGRATAISAVGTAYGGTGTTAQTAKRLCFTTDSAGITSGYHYADSTHVGICMTSAPTEAFEVSGNMKANRLRLTATNDAEVASDNETALILGDRSGTHLTMDGNEIIAKTNGTTSGTLYLNSGSAGGLVAVGHGGLTVNGPITANSTFTTYNSAIGGSIYFKPTRNTDDKVMGAINYYASGSTSATAYNLSSFYFTQYSYTKDTYTQNGYYDRYNLPSVAAGKTENNTYNILTTKNTVTVAQGGTGKSSWTANRMVWTSDSNTLTGGNHWVDSSHVGINMTSAPEATLGVKGEIHATSLIQTGGNSHRAYLYFRPTAPSMSTGYIRMINGSSGASAISDSYFAIIQNSYTASSNTVLNTTETFRLPSTAAGLTASATYSILTSKNTVTVAQGGTGKTTRIDAANYLLNGLDTGSSTPVDADYYISQYVGGGTTTTTYHRRPMSALWAYVKGKMSVTNSGPTLAWGTTSTVGTVAGTALKVTMPANPNTDAKVQQARSAATNWRPVLMHYTNGSFGTDPGAATNCVYYNESVAISPSGGHIQAAGHLITGTYVNAGSYIKAGSYGFISSYLSCGALIVGKNNDAAGHTYTGYGTSKPKGNVTAVLGRVYFQLV